MSRSLWSNIRAKVRLFGRFLEWLPTTNCEASCFSEKNSKLDASSNGCMMFFLEKFVPFGFFKRNFQSVLFLWKGWYEVVKDGLALSGCGRWANKDGIFRIFNEFGRTFFKEPFRPCIFWLSIRFCQLRIGGGKHTLPVALLRMQVTNRKCFKKFPKRQNQFLGLTLRSYKDKQSRSSPGANYKFDQSQFHISWHHKHHHAAKVNQVRYSIPSSLRTDS